MKIKSLLGKLKKKKSESPELVEDGLDEVFDEIEAKNTSIEEILHPEKSEKEEAIAEDKAEANKGGAKEAAEIIGDVEIYINNEKINSIEISKEISIGRDPSQSAVSIPELIVSKLHCTIYVKEGEAFIRDNGSTNGTYVNNQKISDYQLEDRDYISLGKKGTVQLLYKKR